MFLRYRLNGKGQCRPGWNRRRESMHRKDNSHKDFLLCCRSINDFCQPPGRGLEPQALVSRFRPGHPNRRPPVPDCWQYNPHTSVRLFRWRLPGRHCCYRRRPELHPGMFPRNQKYKDHQHHKTREGLNYWSSKR